DFDRLEILLHLAQHVSDINFIKSQLNMLPEQCLANKFSTQRFELLFHQFGNSRQAKHISECNKMAKPVNRGRNCKRCSISCSIPNTDNWVSHTLHLFKLSTNRQTSKL